MTPDDKFVAVAGVNGWRIANPENDRLDYRHWIPPGKVVEANVMYGDKPPNYPHDLNAMRDAEKMLFAMPYCEYRGDLASLYFGYWLPIVCKCVAGNDSPSSEYYEYNDRHASAEQRFEAYVRTLRLGKN